MIRGVCFLLCTALCMISYAQKEPTLDELISQTNTYVDWYGIPSPFETEFSIHKLQLPAEILSEMNSLNLIDEDTIYTSEYRYYFQQKIFNLLKAVVTHKNVTKESLVKGLKSDEGMLVVVVSDDGKLYNFSLDECTGGSYRSRLSFMYYAGLRGLEFLDVDRFLMEGELPEAYSVFGGNGYDELYAIPGEKDVKYVLTGTDRTCGTCYFNHIAMVTLRNGKFETDFSYSVETRKEPATMVYDTQKKLIQVNYLTGDLAQACVCANFENEEEFNFPDNDAYNEPEKPCQCIFIYKAGNFVVD